MKKLIFTLAFFACAVSVGRSSDIVMQVVTPNGDSKTCADSQIGGGYPAGILIENYMWGSSIPVGTNVNAPNFGAPLGNASAVVLTVQKPMDACTPLLLTADVNGLHISSLTITGYGLAVGGIGQVPHWQLVLTNAIITSYVIDGGDTGAPQETWTIAFQKACTTDMLDKQQQVCWNFATSTAN